MAIHVAEVMKDFIEVSFPHHRHPPPHANKRLGDGAAPNDRHQLESRLGLHRVRRPLALGDPPGVKGELAACARVPPPLCTPAAAAASTGYGIYAVPLVFMVINSKWQVHCQRTVWILFMGRLCRTMRSFPEDTQPHALPSSFLAPKDCATRFGFPSHSTQVVYLRWAGYCMYE